MNPIYEVEIALGVVAVVQQIRKLSPKIDGLAVVLVAMLAAALAAVAFAPDAFTTRQIVQMGARIVFGACGGMTALKYFASKMAPPAVLAGEVMTSEGPTLRPRDLAPGEQLEEAPLPVGVSPPPEHVAIVDALKGDGAKLARDGERVAEDVARSGWATTRGVRQ